MSAWQFPLFDVSGGIGGACRHDRLLEFSVKQQ